MTVPFKEPQTVRPDGSRVASHIDGVVVTQPPLHSDEQGDLTEVWTSLRDPLGAGVAHAYMVSVRTGKARGWQMHRLQTDRVFVLSGRLRIGLWDGRPGSPTEGMLNVHTFSERNRALILIPPGVWHGFQNVGEGEAIFLNMPTHAYDYEDPDKYRLPLKNDLIPFDFDEGLGW